MNKIKAICDVAGVDDIGKLSDGYHTFNGLYEQRMILGVGDSFCEHCGADMRGEKDG